MEILKLCIDNGYLLDKEMLDYFNNLEKGEAEKIINSFSVVGIKKGVVTREIFNSFFNKISELESEVYKKGSCVKIISSFNFSNRKIEVRDFINHFRSRFEFLKSVLEKKSFNDLISIRKIGSNNGVYTIIASVLNKRITKNKNLIFEVEDLSGSCSVLVNHDKKQIFEKAKNLLMDDIVAFRVSGSNKMLFVNDIIYPDSKLEEEKFGRFEEYIAFSSDFHVGSKNFLEKNLLRFIKWLNGGVGDDRQKSIARKVKYLFLIGDNIDGIGIYSGQEKDLDIKSSISQYRKFEELLKLIRKDIQIIICPGQHDSVWLGEPQLPISKVWASGLYEMENVNLVSNPAMVEVSGFKVLIYHGASINHFINQMSDIRVECGHNCPTRVIKEILKRRHLAPTHGLMDYIPIEDKDPLVIDIIPDIIATADQHRAEVCSYNNILIVASSCWQSVTSFEEKVGNVPDPCKVPILNLETKEVKILDFSDVEIKWEEGDDLVCKL